MRGRLGHFSLPSNSKAGFQTITFAALEPMTVGDADVDPGATASSGLTVSYLSSNESVATIVDGLIHAVGAGYCVITAIQDGNSTYNAAPSVSQTLTVESEELEYLDLSTAAWVDASGWLAITPAAVVGEEVGEDDDCWVVFDAGEGYFDGNIAVTFTMNIPSKWDGVAHRFCLFASTLTDARALDLANEGIGVGVVCYDGYWVLNVVSFTAGTIGPVVAELVYGNDYYCTYSRNWVAQTATLEVYADVNRTVLLATKTIDLTRGGIADGQEEFQYFFIFNGYKMGDAEDQGSFTTSNMNITPELP